MAEKGTDIIEKELSECQNYHYSQSSKVSSLSRNIVYGIIGTCWVLIYADNLYHEPCIWIIITLGLGFVYLLLDLAHYFSDSCSYKKEYFELEQKKNTEVHEEFMNKVAKRSFALLRVKFYFVLVIAVAFVIAIIIQLNVFQ